MMELPPLAAMPLLALFITWPALDAWRRRRRSQSISVIATALAEYASAVRREGRCLPLDEPLRSRLIELRLGEITALELARDMPRADAALLADTAQRLATRLRRRVAFERKMLARTAPGRRRGAIAASLPALVMLTLIALGWHLPGSAVAAVLAVEGLGCLLLWRLSHVEI